MPHGEGYDVAMIGAGPSNMHRSGKSHMHNLWVAGVLVVLVITKDAT